MITSLNSDCSIITFNSDGLLQPEGTTIDSIALKYRSNCSSTETEVDLTDLIEDVADGALSVSSAIFYSDETKDVYCDGIYYFQLDIVYTNGDGTFQISDSACQLIDCTLKCKVLEYYTSTKDKNVWYYYTALTLGNSCDSCYCTEMCSLYTELKLLLNDNSINIDTSGCGCS